MDGFFNNQLSITDPEISNAIEKEKMRQKEQVELIASENIVSQAVLDAQGSILTNKYAEGYSGRRYYGGCEFIDDLETIGINRVKELFNCKYANIQPHSGAQANQAVFMSLIKPGDTILGMSLAAGGHLTHGAPPNLSGKWFNAIQYGVRKQDALIDFDQLEADAMKTLHFPAFQLWYKIGLMIQMTVCQGVYPRMVRNQFREEIIILTTKGISFKTHDQSSFYVMILHQGLVAEQFIQLDSRT